MVGDEGAPLVYERLIKEIILDLDYQLRLERNQELLKIGAQAQHAIEFLKKLVEERDDFERIADLREKEVIKLRAELGYNTFREIEEKWERNE